MKRSNYIKMNFLVVCLQLIVGNVFAIPTDSLAIEEVKTSVALASGSKGRIDRQKAFETLSKYAEEGNARAMNGLGLMYILGHVSAPDTVQGIYWLTKAGENGFSSAWNNLGVVYKYAHGGVAQNLGKTYYYFEKSAESGNLAGYYNAGYMLYKGLGCEQDYKKAFAYFEKGAARDYAPTMYMLGLCYRNGYGVERSDGNAHYWLAEADRRAYKFATDELEAEIPENSTEKTFLRSAQMISVPLHYAKVEHLYPGENINGVYEGLLVTYDWSGKNIIKETPISLNLVSDGKTIEGEWIEVGCDTVLVKAEQNADKLRFIDTRQCRTDHYTEEEPVLFRFEKAEIQVTTDNSGTSLTGTIKMYSPETMEPERPMYLSLRKANADTSVITKNTVEGLKVYPVPFGNELNISFMQTEEESVKIGIYNYPGSCVYLYDAGKLPAGEQHLVLTPSLPAGMYIVKLITGNRSSQVIVLSNGK